MRKSDQSGTVIEVKKVEEIIQKSNVTAYKLIADLEALRILKEISGTRRDRLCVFQDYLDLFSSD